VAGRHGVTVTGGTVRGFDVGVYLSRTTGDRIDRVTASGNRQGITLDAGANRNEVTGNHVIGVGDGIVITASGNHVSGNVVSRAVGCGNNECGYGISLEAGQRNVIEHNDVSRTVQDGIRIGAFIPEQPTRDNLVTRNVVTSAGNDGISVGAATDGPVGVTAVTLNVVTGAKSDGIHIGSQAVTGAVTLAGNRTVRNGRYGIEAAVAVRDGGGNVASGNHAGVQCTGVLCRPAA
jgi:parallel beta-helix repeat protein